MTAPVLKAGARFVHARQLDPDWKPGPGERFSDGPKRRMRITRVIRGTGHEPVVYYRPDDDGTKGLFVCTASQLHDLVGRWLDG